MSMTRFGWSLWLLALIAFIILSIVVANIFPGYGIEVLYLTGCVICGLILIKAFRPKDQFGNILLGIRDEARFMRAFLIVPAIFNLINVWREEKWLLILTGFVASLLLLIVFIYYFFAKLEIREKVIIHPYTNIKWENIASYNWTGGGQQELNLTIREPKILKKLTWIVPSKQKEAVNKLLSERLRYIKE